MGSDNKPKTDAPTKANPFKLIPFILIPLAIGTGLALVIYRYAGGDATYEAKFEDIANNDLHWTYLAVVVFGRTISYLNFYPMAWKSGMKGNTRANPFFYKTDGGELVVLETEGDIGRYNRANRSVHHMIENFGAFLAGMVLAGQVFPFPVFCLVCLFCLGRILHQSGYTSGYGSHGVGFLFSIVLAGSTMEGLCFLIYLKASGNI